MYICIYIHIHVVLSPSLTHSLSFTPPPLAGAPLSTLREQKMVKESHDAHLSLPPFLSLSPSLPPSILRAGPRCCPIARSLSMAPSISLTHSLTLPHSLPTHSLPLTLSPAPPIEGKALSTLREGQKMVKESHDAHLEQVRV